MTRELHVRFCEGEGVQFPFATRLLILNEQHLRRVLAVFVAHYDGHRPHRALGLNPVRCENSAHVGSPWNWRIDVAGGRRVRLEIRPIDIVLEPG